MQHALTLSLSLSLGVRVYNANSPATLHVTPCPIFILPTPPDCFVNKQKLIHDRGETGIKIRVGIQVQCTSLAGAGGAGGAEGGGTGKRN